MSTVYTFTVYIENAGTDTPEDPNIFGTNYSLAGHMWWRAEKYENRTKGVRFI